MIMLVLTILSAGVAVNFYGPISQSWLLEYIPDYGDSAALIVLFTVCLVVLRTIADNFVRSNIIIWLWPDRILAGVLSIPTALVLVGMGSIAFQMLPFDGQVMLFNRFKDNGQKLERSGIFPFADDFTAGVLSMLSRGSLQNEEKLGMVHPDWPGEISAQRIGVQKESKHAILPGLVQVMQAWKREGPLMVKEYKLSDGSNYRSALTKTPPKVTDKRLAANGSYYLVVRMTLDPKAADGDGFHRFGWGQIRLVGFIGNDRTAPLDYYTIGVRDPDMPVEFNFMRVKVMEPPDSKDDEAVAEERDYGLVTRQAAIGPMSFDVVFEVPEGFAPWFIEYKRWGRADMSKVKISEKGPGEDEAKKMVVEEKGSVGQVAVAGVHNQFQADPQRTAFTNEFPFKLVGGAARGDVEISGTKFVHGRISGTLGQAGGLDSGSGPVISEFDVSADKRLLRVECNFVSADNQMVQNVFGMVGTVAQQKAIDKQGNVYLPIGKYIILNVPGGDQVELIYNGTGVEGEASAGRDQFQSINRGQLQSNGGKVGFLYAVPPGTQMDRFEPGRPFESQTLELKAPN